MSSAEVEAGFYYTKEHEWVSIEENVVTIGITDYAQRTLGDLVFVELPEEGEEVTKGDTPIIVESYKAASDVYAPVSGRVVAVNSTLVEEPEQVNQAPYEDGWLIKIKLSDKSEIEDLMNVDSYQEYLAELEE